MTQADIYNLLKSNPLGVNVHIGSLDDMKGQDYIFLDYINDVLIGYDDKGMYQSFIQISIYTKQFETRRKLVKFVKEHFNVSVSYETSTEFNYFSAICQCGVLLED